jgi:hypothetical protein
MELCERLIRTLHGRYLCQSINTSLPFNINTWWDTLCHWTIDCRRWLPKHCQRQMMRIIRSRFCSQRLLIHLPYLICSTHTTQYSTHTTWEQERNDRRLQYAECNMPRKICLHPVAGAWCSCQHRETLGIIGNALLEQRDFSLISCTCMGLYWCKTNESISDQWDTPYDELNTLERWSINLSPQ